MTGSRWGGRQPAPADPGPQTRRRPRRTRRGARRLDGIELTEPRIATLRLLRHRVLEQTRKALRLPRSSSLHIEWSPGPADRAEVFVGRLLSDQNLLAGKRRGHWDSAQLDAALEEGMTNGLSETLDILEDIRELDEEAWDFVCGVMEEFQRKVGIAVGGLGEEPSDDEEPNDPVHGGG